MDRGVLFGMVFVVLGLSTAQTKECCTPDQWQGLLSLTVKGQGIPDYAFNYISYDYTNRRLAFFWNITDSAGQVSSYEDLELYSGPNTGMRYSLDFKTRKCLVQTLSGPFTKFCNPEYKIFCADPAQKVGDLTLGASTESLPVTIFYTGT